MNRSAEQGRITELSRRGGRAGGRSRGVGRAGGIGRVSSAIQEAHSLIEEEDHQEEQQLRGRQMIRDYSSEPAATTSLDTSGIQLAHTFLDSFGDLSSSSTRHLQGEDHDTWELT